MDHDDLRYGAVGFAVIFAVILLGTLVMVAAVKEWF